MTKGAVPFGLLLRELRAVPPSADYAVRPHSQRGADKLLAVEPRIEHGLSLAAHFTDVNAVVHLIARRPEHPRAMPILYIRVADPL